ncbi:MULTISPECIES: hypothetical protein [Burkholderia cepacia complex]|uniref:hypothetical protein n=1 Tax=Burkholderia cepacia complex TaxID=87882 RepID=UPI000A6525CE|nr:MULTISPECIES: hypothetical protein [Burkholderia cepacia complex]
MNQTISSDKLLSEIGGLPFIDREFSARKLLTFVAMLRRDIDDARHPPQAYLDPHLSAELYREKGRGSVIYPLSSELTQMDSATVQEIVGRIVKQRPDWKSLFEIPLIFRRLDTDQVSLTNPLIPQQVFLGTRALSDEFLLPETIVHELSHVWSGFILEIFDYQHDGCPENYVLPSGTPNKDIRGVVLAALFAAAVLDFYVSNPNCAQHARISARISYLRSYLDGCIDTVFHSHHTSSMGRAVTERLAAYTSRLFATQPI